MDYKEKYEQAIENLKKIKAANKDNKELVDFIENKYPELKESEDEKMLRTLREGFNILNKDDEWYSGITNGQILTWLEKQGELVNSLSKGLDNAHERIDGLIQKNNSLIEQLEKQGEQKPGDKVEPKFKVGDWIVTDKNHIWYVDETPDTTSYLYRLINQYIKVEVAEFEIVDMKARLWTIQDAKDGDVLAFNDGHGNDCIELIKSITDKKIEFWFCLTNGNRYEVFDGITPYTNLVSRENATPATKEQRDLLFQKMYEAGYEWDAEKKELKKIEQKPDMIQWKGNNLKEIIDFTGKDKNFDKWFKSFAEYEKYVSEHDNVFKLFNADGSHFEIPVGAWIVKTPDGYNVASKAIFKNKPAEWTKEDETCLEDVLWAIEQARPIAKKKNVLGNLRHAEKWLKSLILRPYWKPTNGQMKILRKYVMGEWRDLTIGQDKILTCLYTDLQKLL